jgi:hypothetical protein
MRAALKKAGEKLRSTKSGRRKILTVRVERKFLSLFVEENCSNAIDEKKRLEADPTVSFVSDSTYRRTSYCGGYR